jgi:hypothetical protein
MVVDKEGNVLSVELNDDVRVRTVQELAEKYGFDEYGEIPCKKEVFTRQMFDFGGLKAKVTEIKKNSKGRPTGIIKLNGELYDFWHLLKFDLSMIKSLEDAELNETEPELNENETKEKVQPR